MPWPAVVAYSWQYVGPSGIMTFGQTSEGEDINKSLQRAT